MMEIRSKTVGGPPDCQDKKETLRKGKDAGIATEICSTFVSGRRIKSQT